MFTISSLWPDVWGRCPPSKKQRALKLNMCWCVQVLAALGSFGAYSLLSSEPLTAAQGEGAGWAS